METDKNLETLEEEFKLMKGEMKQSLTSVRDYLLNMELPSSEFATVLAALGGEDNQKITLDGSLLSKMAHASDNPPPAEKEEEPAPEKPQGESLEAESGLPPEDEPVNQYEHPEPVAELLPEKETDEQDESFMPESELPPEEERQMGHEKINDEASQSTPKVNLLANLMHWVTKTKKEIGSEQLPVFLEVYGISGHLSPELKEVILHLADIASEQSESASAAETWSQAMLSLHGILTGSNAPLYSLKPFWKDDDSEIQLIEDEVTETVVEKPKDMPVKLKLVFPNGDDKGKEFCLNLSPALDNNES